jgi:uncharacterized membrane protein
MMRKVFNYFLQGLLVTVPVVVTFVVLFKAMLWIDSLLPFQIPVKIPGFPNLEMPGLGILAIFFLITVFGYFASTLVANPAFTLLEKLLGKTPLLKVIYTSVKDLIEAFVGEKKRFTQPVLVTMSKEPHIQRIGFVTENDLSGLGLPMGTIAVYCPFSYGFNGQLFIMPAENVTKINASGTETMKFIISGGVTEI